MILDFKEDECGSEDIIVVSIFGGIVNYKVSWNGFMEGFVIIGGIYVEILNFIVGIYMVDIIDVNGCVVSVEIFVIVGIVDLLDVVVLNGDCEEVGELKLMVIGGIVDYIIEWSGLDDGFIMISEIFIMLGDFFVGDYMIKLIDVNGCIDEVVVIIMVMEGVGIRLVGIDGDCMVVGYIFVDVIEGLGFFIIEWFGVVEGLDVFDGEEYFIIDFLGGIYIVKVMN